MLSKQEKQVLDVLAAAWNQFLLLPEIHPSDRPEFLFSIHQAQNIVLSRPTVQWLKLHQDVEQPMDEGEDAASVPS